MNEKAVLMCFNIPRGIKEEHLYELFCNAGPIDCIHFGKSGRSVFVVYEFKEAVATAKEIFKNVKLYGKLIRMFDREDIENIHARQEEELIRKRPYEADNGRNGPPMKQRRYDGYPRHVEENYQQSYSPDQMFSSDSSFQESVGSYSEEGSGKYPMEQDSQNTVSVSNRNYPEPSATPSILDFRPDLLPTNQPYSRDKLRRAYDTSLDTDSLRNPYQNPVSRHGYRDRSHRYEDFRSRKCDKPYDRRDHRNYRRSRSPPLRNQYRNQGHQNHPYRSRRH